MTHTKRIYNNPNIKKAQRYLATPNEIQIHPIIRMQSDRMIGIPYTRYSSICMGRCPACRDHTKEQRLLRKQRKEQFRLQLRNELDTHLPPLDELNPWDIV